MYSMWLHVLGHQPLARFCSRVLFKGTLQYQAWPIGGHVSMVVFQKSTSYRV